MTAEIDLISQVRHVLQQNKAKKILVAVSGGVDSMALSDIVDQIWSKRAWGIVNVDHDLRPTSAKETEFVQQFCHNRDIQFFTTKWNRNQANVGVEAAAREFRYDYFQQIMRENGFDTLLTAHHANDLSENILMKLVRSGNVYEITSLKSQREFGHGQIVRPLLTASKKDLHDYAQQRSLNYVQDESNFEDITMRNRLRSDILPKLQTENGQLLRHFGLFDQQMNALLSIAADKFDRLESEMKLQETDSTISGQIGSLQEIPANQQSLFWGRLFTKKMPHLSISNKQIRQIIAVIKSEKPNSEVDLENGWRFRRSYLDFEITQPDELASFDLAIKPGQEYSLGKLRFKIFETTQENADIAVTKRPDSMRIRTRKPGDRLLLDHQKHQKLSKRFINEKVPAKKRAQIPILLFDNQVVWVEKIYNISDYLIKKQIFYKIDFNEV